jgi:16S rRNA processing protein RimM
MKKNKPTQGRRRQRRSVETSGDDFFGPTVPHGETPRRQDPDGITDKRGRRRKPALGSGRVFGAAARDHQQGHNQRGMAARSAIPLPDAPKNPVCVAAVAGVHGIKGAVRLKSFTEEPEDCTSYGRVWLEDGTHAFDVTYIGTSKGVVIAQLEGVQDRTDAENLRGTRLFVDKSQLPELDEDEFYPEQLKGLQVFDCMGTAIGTVLGMYDFGAGDIMEIRYQHNGISQAVMLPFTEKVVPEISIAAGKVVVDMPDGLLATPDDGTEQAQESGENET